MKLWSISMRNLRIRLVSTVLTTIAIAVATGLYAAIMLMAEQTRDRYEGSIGGYQAVLGPKDCSQLALLLNTIFHVGDAPGQIPLSVCDDLRAGKVSRRGAVRYAIPQARGDSISRWSFPVIGTVDEMFSLYEWQRAPLQFAEGGPWAFTYAELQALGEQLATFESARRAGEKPLPPRPQIDAKWKKAVVGHRVARAMQLSLGSTIVPVHGKHGEFGYHEHPEAACEVVGILAPTNSPLDTTVFLPLSVHLLVGGLRFGLLLFRLLLLGLRSRLWRGLRLWLLRGEQRAGEHDGECDLHGKRLSRSGRGCRQPGSSIPSRQGANRRERRARPRRREGRARAAQTSPTRATRPSFPPRWTEGAVRRRGSTGPRPPRPTTTARTPRRR